MSASITSGTYPRAGARIQTPRHGALSQVWQFFVDLGRARAHPELMRLSRRYAVSDPALSRNFASAARDLLKG